MKQHQQQRTQTSPSGLKIKTEDVLQYQMGSTAILRCIKPKRLGSQLFDNKLLPCNPTIIFGWPWTSHRRRCDLLFLRST